MSCLRQLYTETLRKACCGWSTATRKVSFQLGHSPLSEQIDVARGTLRNVLEFGGGGGGGALVVGSTIAPADTADGARFDFAFSACELRVGALTVPLPPVGRGWGELLYLDDELRVQRDVRGDVIIARKVGAA